MEKKTNSLGKVIWWKLKFGWLWKKFAMESINYSHADGQENGWKNFEAPHSSGTFLLLLLKRYFGVTFACSQMWLVSLGRKRCKDKERASWGSFCESCEERDVESRPGRQPCCGWQQFLRASGKGKGGSGSFRLGVCSSRWVLRRMLLEDCNFLPGNSWSKKRLKIFNSRWVGYRRWTFLDLAYCHAFGAHDRFISV